MSTLSREVRAQQFVFCTYGRTGNQLFQILAATVLAQQSGLKLYFYFGDPLVINDVLHLNLKTVNMYPTYTAWTTSVKSAFDQIDIQKYRITTVSIHGFFEEWEFVKQHQRLAWELFRFKKPLQLKQEVCVHLRLGDLSENLPKLGDRFPTVIADDILSKKIPTNYPIVLISETPEHTYVEDCVKVLKEILPDHSVTIQPPTTVQLDFIRLSESEYLYATNSTLTFWTAFLGKMNLPKKQSIFVISDLMKYTERSHALYIKETPWFCEVIQLKETPIVNENEA
jgi:hypothetical protein